MSEGKSILFLCSGNSCRSQMAEGFMKHLSHGDWRVESAGIFPSYVHPLAIRVMEEVGIDLSEQTSKSMDLFLNETFDYADHPLRACSQVLSLLSRAGEEAELVL